MAVYNIVYSLVLSPICLNFIVYTPRVKGLVLSPAADLLFSASSDGTIKAWKLQDPLVSVHDSTYIIFFTIAIIIADVVGIQVLEFH